MKKEDKETMPQADVLFANLVLGLGRKGAGAHGHIQELCVQDPGGGHHVR